MFINKELKFLMAAISLMSSSQAISNTAFIQRATNAAVFIHTDLKYGFQQDKKPKKKAEGSGFILDKSRGLIMTNAHVAGHGQSEIKLRFFKQRKLVVAKKIFVDPYHDVAILQVRPDLMPDYVENLELDCDYQPSRGEEVVAIGHPENTEFTITRGVVSGDFDDNVDGIFWSTDLVIEPGSSGGAAISLATGKVIGIPTAGWDESDISLLTKASDACMIWRPIVAGLPAARPQLGFQQMMVDGYLSRFVGLVSDRQSPLVPGDEILGWGDGHTWDVEVTPRFADLLRGYTEETVTLQLLRNGKPLTVVIPVRRGINEVERNWVYFTGLTFTSTLQEDANRLVDYYPESIIQLQSSRKGTSDLLGFEVRNLSILHSVNGVRISSIRQLAEVIAKARDDEKSVEVVFNAPDYTSEAERYMFKQTLMVKDFDTNFRLSTLDKEISISEVQFSKDVSL